MPTFHFYDALVVGKHPAEGQLLRYDYLHAGGGSDTSGSLQIKLRDDVFINPVVAELSDIATQDLNAGLTELEWSRIAHLHFTAFDCLHVAFGATSRLEQYIRFSMYRNLLPFPCVGLPNWLCYLDIETLCVAIKILRPDEFPWPDLKGKPPAMLYQALTWESNALGLNRAERIQEVLCELFASSPRLVEHAIKMSSMQAIKVALGLEHGEVSDLATVNPGVFVHRSIHSRNHALLAFPVAVDMTYPDVLYVADLESDLSVLCDPTTDTLTDLVRTTWDDLTRPLVRVSLSRLPLFSPLKVVRPADALRMGIDLVLVQRNVDRLRESGFLASRLKDEQFYGLASQPFDIYHRMWAGDFSAHDQELMRRLHAAPSKDWVGIAASAQDGRVPDLVERLLGRESPSDQDPAQRESWVSYSIRAAAGDLATSDSIAALKLQAENIATTFPAAVGLAQLNQRMARLLGAP